MSIFLLLLLFIISLILIFFSRKGSLILLSLTIFYFLSITTGLIPAFLLKNLEISSYPSKMTWGAKNVIILLGAGTVKNNVFIKPTIFAYSRINETASLYFDCKKTRRICVIIISGGDVTKTGKSEASVYRDALIRLNINPYDIKLEPNSRNTFENAKFTHALLKTSMFDHVVLVTSAIHLKRSLLYFSHFGINNALGVPSDYLTILSYIPNAANIYLTDIALHEYIGILQLYIYNALNLNH